MRIKLVSAAFLFLAAVALSPAPAPGQAPADPWAPLQFLVGNWTGIGSGNPGEAVSGSTSFAFDLGKKVLVRKNRAEYAPKAGEKQGAVHEDLMIIYTQAGDPKLRAVYFDNEGHVINYTLSFPGKQPSAVFESEGTEKAPRFRLVYELGADGLLTIDFLIAPPGGEFKSYVKGTAKRAA